MTSPSVSLRVDPVRAGWQPFQRASRRRPGTLARRQSRLFYLLVLPWVIGFVGLTAGPMVYSAYLSLTHYDVLSPPHFVGFANYQEAFQNPLFWQSLKVTAVYAVVSVPLDLAVSLGLALLLNQKLRAIRAVRTLVYLPSVLSGVGVSTMFLYIFNPQVGLINDALRGLGLQGPGWIESSTWALPSLILMTLWGVGGEMLIVLAALQSVPQVLIEAATIDGAGRWRRFIKIVVPMISPAILFNLVLGIIGQFQAFTQAYVITSGGPLHSTFLFVYYLFDSAFQQLQFGYASALAWVLFIIVLALTVLVMATSARWVFYHGDTK